MKRVVRIERQGKRNDRRTSTQGTLVTPEEIDCAVALIQALIPLGLHAVSEALEGRGGRLGRRLVPPDGWTPLPGPLGQQPGSV